LAEIDGDGFGRDIGLVEPTGGGEATVAGIKSDGDAIGPTGDGAGDEVGGAEDGGAEDDAVDAEVEGGCDVVVGAETAAKLDRD
jgi:hypothetical protein